MSNSRRSCELETRQLLLVSDGELNREALQNRTGLADREHFRKQYLRPALIEGHIEMTIPDKPRRRNQKYRLTEQGRHYLDQLEARHESW